MSLSRSSSLLGYSAVAAVLSLVRLGGTDLTQMEPIIGLGAKHMVAHGGWFVPRLYGEVYAYKPALAYWLAAASGVTCGWTEWGMRLPTAMCGMVLGLVVCAVLGRLMSPRCGLVGGLATVMSCLFIEQTRLAGFDMPMALGVGVATLAAMRNLAKSESNLTWWVLGYLGLLFGFLAKGLPAVIMYAAGLVAAAVVLKQVRLLLRWQHLAAVGLLVLGIAAYLIPAVRDGGSLVVTQQLGEMLFRGTRWRVGTVLLSLAKPLYSLTAFLPGSAILLLLFVRRATAGSDPFAARLRSAAWAFLLAGTALLIVSPVNNMRYYLPLSTSLAVLAGLYAESFRFRLPVRMAAGASRLPSMVADPAVWMVLAGCVYWLVYVHGVEPRRRGEDSQRGVAERFAVHIPAGQAVHADAGDGSSSLFWYLERPVCTWRVGAALPPVPAYIILVEKQVEYAARLREKDVVVLAVEQDGEGRRFALCRADGRQ